MHKEKSQDFKRFVNFFNSSDVVSFSPPVVRTPLICLNGCYADVSNILVSL